MKLVFDAETMEHTCAKPIVRCKDCKHFDYYMWRCQLLDTPFINPDCFCSYGEEGEYDGEEPFLTCRELNKKGAQK